MALWAFIPGSTVVRVGPLPQAARRIDGHGGVVLDLSGANIGRAKACGWYDVSTLTDEDLAGLTPQARTAIRASILSAIQARDRRRQFVGLIRDTFWDWLDAYSGVPITGSPNAGVSWPALTANGKVEALRDQTSRLSLAMLLLVDVLEDVIDDMDIAPPT